MRYGWIIILPKPETINNKEILALLLCLLLGFALRFYTFDQRSLWLDEVYTFEDSRDDLKAQFKFYQENSTFLHPPLFFILTHQFYPFPKPERDLRIIPLIFGTLSIPMIYLLARSFAPQIALPCAISLALMAYHICISQDGRVYSFLMFFGMMSLFLLIRYLKTFKWIYLILSALVYNLLFFSSYSSIPFIVFSQILWFYQPREDGQKPKISSFFILSGLTSLLIIVLARICRAQLQRATRDGSHAYGIPWVFLRHSLWGAQ